MQGKSEGHLPTWPWNEEGWCTHGLREAPTQDFHRESRSIIKKGLFARTSSVNSHLVAGDQGSEELLGETDLREN